MKYWMIVLFNLFCLCCAKADDTQDAKRSEKTEKIAKQLEEKIGKEIKSLGTHDWAGEYYAGDGLGMNQTIILAPKSGYLYEWHGCCGLYDRNYGAIQEKDGKLKLSFTFPNKTTGFRIGEEFYPIRWGKRKYLIAPGDMIKFCNDINSGDEPRNKAHGFFLMGCEDEKIQVTGFPQLPPSYKHFLLNKPIQAEIIKLSEPYPISRYGLDGKETTVTLNVGAAEGVFDKMEFNSLECFSKVFST